MQNSPNYVITIPADQWSVIHRAVINVCMNLSGVIDRQELERAFDSIVDWSIQK